MIFCGSAISYVKCNLGGPYHIRSVGIFDPFHSRHIINSAHQKNNNIKSKSVMSIYKWTPLHKGS